MLLTSALPLAAAPKAALTGDSPRGPDRPLELPDFTTIVPSERGSPRDRDGARFADDLHNSLERGAPVRHEDKAGPATPPGNNAEANPNPAPGADAPGSAVPSAPTANRPTDLDELVAELLAAMSGLPPVQPLAPAAINPPESVPETAEGEELTAPVLAEALAGLPAATLPTVEAGVPGTAATLPTVEAGTPVPGISGPVDVPAALGISPGPKSLPATAADPARAAVEQAPPFAQAMPEAAEKGLSIAAAATEKVPVAGPPPAPTGKFQPTLPFQVTHVAPPSPHEASPEAVADLNGDRGATALAETPAVSLLVRAIPAGQPDTDQTREATDRDALPTSRPSVVQAAGPGTARSVPPASAQVAGAILARAEIITRPGRTDFHMRLEPPELGTVRVHLTATEHSLTARLYVSEETARQLLESQLHSLRQRLTEAGITLDSFHVARDGAGTPGQGQHGWFDPLGPAFPDVPEPERSEVSWSYGASSSTTRVIDVVV